MGMSIVEGYHGFHIYNSPITSPSLNMIHPVKFRLPTTSKHALINGSTKKKIRETEPHVHENQLTEEQTRVLKSLGKRRVSSYYVKAIMKDLFSDLNMTDDLMWRVHGKGREEAYGSDDQTMALFIDRGNDWRKNGGSFQTQTCDLALHSWSGQMELELLLANLYGRDSYYVDTTFGAGNWGHKLGLIKVVDAFGFTAPGGSLMVPEEDGVSIHERLDHLGYNVHRCRRGMDISGGGGKRAITQ